MKFLFLWLLFPCILASCILFNNTNEGRINTSYKIAALIKEKNYSEIKKLLKFGLVGTDDEIFHHNVDQGSRLINEYGVPDKNKLHIDYLEGGEYIQITFPLHEQFGKEDTVLRANIQFVFKKNVTSQKICTFDVNVAYNDTTMIR